MKIKKTIIIILTLAICLSTTANADTSHETRTSIVTITLDDAQKQRQISNDQNSQNARTPIPYTEKDNTLTIPIEDALVNLEIFNPDILLYDQKITLYQKQYDAALDDAQNAKAYQDNSDIDMRKKEMLNWRIKLYNLQNMIYDRKEKLISIRHDFTQNYNDILLQQQNIIIKQNEIKNLQIEIKNIRTHIALGLAKKSELDAQSQNLAVLSAELASSNRNIETKIRSLKNMLGISQDKRILLQPYQTTYVKYDDHDINKNINNALDKSHDLAKLKEELDLTRLQYTIDVQYFDNAVPAEADTLKTSIEDKTASIETTRLSTAANLWSAYYNLKNQEDTIQIEQINTDLALQKLELVKTKVRLHKAPSEDLLSAELALSKQKYQLQSSVNIYMAALEDFQNQLNN